MTTSYTRTLTTTMTEARVRHVMMKVSANLNALVARRLLEASRAASWERDLTYLQIEEVLEFFEIQFSRPSGIPYGLRYAVSADGTLVSDQRSGGLVDLYGIPAGTSASLYVHLKKGVSQRIYDTLAARGWGFDGRALNGEHAAHRSFSKDGYGLTRSQVGAWPE